MSQERTPTEQTTFLAEKAQATPTSQATKDLLVKLINPNIPLPSELLTKIAAISTKQRMDDLAIALAKRNDLTKEITDDLSKDTRLAVRRAYISAESRTLDQIRAAIDSEKRPTALGDIIDDKETSETVVEILAERDSSLLAMKILERESSSSLALKMALSTIDKAKRKLTWSASLRLKSAIAADLAIAQYIAENLNRVELLFYTQSVPLAPAAFDRLATLLVTEPLSTVVKLRPVQTSYGSGYDRVTAEIQSAISSAAALMNNLEVPPLVGVAIASTCAIAFKKMGPGATPYEQQVSAAMNKFTSLDIITLTALPKLSKPEVELAATSNDLTFIQGVLLSAELMAKSSPSRSELACLALITNPNLPESCEGRTLDRLKSAIVMTPLLTLHQLLHSAPPLEDTSWAKRRILQLITRFPDNISTLPELDPWLLDQINKKYVGQPVHAIIWSAALRNKQILLYTILNAPWEIVIAHLKSLPTHHASHATILSSLLAQNVLTPTRFSLFDQLQADFKGSTAELLDTVTSLAGE